MRSKVRVRNYQYDVIRFDFHRSVGYLSKYFDVDVGMPINLQDDCTRTLSIDQQFFIRCALSGKRSSK